MVPEKVLQFARENGYDNAEYIAKWRGYDCYEPIAGDGTETAFIGLPLMIMADAEGRIRMSTPQEAMEQLDESCESTDS